MQRKLSAMNAVTGKSPWPMAASGLTEWCLGARGSVREALWVVSMKSELLKSSSNIWHTQGQAGQRKTCVLALHPVFLHCLLIPPLIPWIQRFLEWKGVDGTMDVLDRDIPKEEASRQGMDPKCWHFRCDPDVRQTQGGAVNLPGTPQRLACNRYLWF